MAFSHIFHHRLKIIPADSTQFRQEPIIPQIISVLLKHHQPGFFRILSLDMGKKIFCQFRPNRLVQFIIMHQSQHCQSDLLPSALLHIVAQIIVSAAIILFPAQKHFGEPFRVLRLHQILHPRIPLHEPFCRPGILEIKQIERVQPAHNCRQQIRNIRLP